MTDERNNNEGDSNVGNHNVGDWNTCDFGGGCFCTTDAPEQNGKICFFSKPSGLTLHEWRGCAARWALERAPFVPEATADAHAAAMQTWWHGLPEKKRDAILAIPNFDAIIFKKNHRY